MIHRLVLRLMAITYQIYHVSSGLQTGTLKVQVSEGRDGMASCQTCVLDTLGATRMKLELYWKVNDKSFATYTISGSDFVFANLELDCISNKKCIVHELEMSASENGPTTVSEEPIISLDESSSVILDFN